MVDKQGTVCDDWVLVEAECSEDEDLEELFDKSTESDISDLVDNASCNECQGISLELFRQQESAETEEQLLQLKRKYYHSPDKAVANLSPRLSSISLTPKKGKKAKKVLFGNNDSGVEVSQHEALNSFGQREKQVEKIEAAVGGVDVLLRSSNHRAFVLGKFKENFGLSFTELVRSYKSDKTCSMDWVICGMYFNEDRSEAAKTLLQDYCDYMFFSQMGICTLMMLNFKNQKSRETLKKLLKSLLNVHECQIIADPPKTRSTPCALYWYKRGSSNCAYTYGQLPDWIARQTLLSHQMAGEKPFDLSMMIQWAYDNEKYDESDIAYGYALLADTDDNAIAFLNSNNQAKHVRDCATMCRHYRKAEMQRMSISEWIHKSCKRAEGEGDWKEIVKFLRLQSVEFITFLSDFKKFLKGFPKKNCLVFWGPPNTGKSMFCMSLLTFLRGRVISYVNSKSQFWLQPLTEAKIGLLDDATKPCWDYFDLYLRNLLDGNSVSIDCKHRAPLQLKSPPLMVTTNINVWGDERWKYLRSRISGFCFAAEFPFKEDGSPGFLLNDKSWASFFERFWIHLDLSDQEDEGEDGDPPVTLRVSTRGASEPL
nr:MAG: early protein 1 [Ailuropoda melanoleuca papillomavirus 5]